MILTQAQAEAVYAAMCALNNVSAIARNIQGLGECRTLTLSQQWTEVIEIRNGTGRVHERYTDRAEFAIAYGLI